MVVLPWQEPYCTQCALIQDGGFTMTGTILRTVCSYPRWWFYHGGGLLRASSCPLCCLHLICNTNNSVQIKKPHIQAICHVFPFPWTIHCRKISRGHIAILLFSLSFSSLECWWGLGLIFISFICVCLCTTQRTARGSWFSHPLCWSQGSELSVQAWQQVVSAAEPSRRLKEGVPSKNTVHPPSCVRTAYLPCGKLSTSWSTFPGMG